MFIIYKAWGKFNITPGFPWLPSNKLYQPLFLCFYYQLSAFFYVCLELFGKIVFFKVFQILWKHVLSYPCQECGNLLICVYSRTACTEKENHARLFYHFHWNPGWLFIEITVNNFSAIKGLYSVMTRLTLAMTNSKLLIRESLILR